MLKPAHLYKDEITRKMYETWYNPEYLYYYDTNQNIPEFSDRPENEHQFASVDKNDNVIGYFSYKIDTRTSSACCFGAISFEKGNLIFTKDMFQAIKDCFYKYNLQRIEWWCYANNPISKSYEKFALMHGGGKVGHLTRAGKTIDNKLSDLFIFEILKENFK